MQVVGLVVVPKAGTQGMGLLELHKRLATENIALHVYKWPRVIVYMDRWGPLRARAFSLCLGCRRTKAAFLLELHVSAVSSDSELAQLAAASVARGCYLSAACC